MQEQRSGVIDGGLEREDLNQVADRIHSIYEDQAAQVTTSMTEMLWNMIEGVLTTLNSTSLDAARLGWQIVQRDPRHLIAEQASPDKGTEPHRVSFVMDSVTDLPEAERPGPFTMGNARVVVVTEPDTGAGVQTWMLRAMQETAASDIWVTEPGSVPVDTAMIRAIFDGNSAVTRSATQIITQVPTEVEQTEVGTGGRWTITDLYSGQPFDPNLIFEDGNAARDYLRQLVRDGVVGEGDWQTSPLDASSTPTV